MVLEYAPDREGAIRPTVILSAEASVAARSWFACGALLGLLAVASAALASHLPDRMLAIGGRSSLQAAVQIIGWHAGALLAAALWLRNSGLPRLVHLAATAFLVGTACFCVGVAVPAFGGAHLGRLAPAGGSLLMVGWALLAASALRGRDR